MHFVKQTFMGIELDILVGHPDHDILFIATQVARAAGLKNPKRARGSAIDTIGGGGFLQIKSLESKVSNFETLNPRIGTNRWKDIWLATEASAYEMLLRGHAPASEQFRKWVTETVLPTIRKTGKYDIEEATDEASKQFAGEFAALHAKISDLEGLIKQLLERPAAPPVQVTSPYEGTPPIILPDVFSKATYREMGDTIGLQRPALDRLEARVPLAMEARLTKLWETEDGRELKVYTSKCKRKWTQWPSKWVKSRVDRDFYRQVLIEVLNEKVVVE